MKKVLSLLIIIVICLITTACADKIPIKPEYSVREQAVADKINLIINDVNYNNATNTLQIKLNIENKRGNTVTISADESFKLYDINQVQIPNKYTNNVNIIKNKESIPYTLEYNVAKKEIYQLYFYSGIVENNIRFNITSNDITYVNQ